MPYGSLAKTPADDDSQMDIDAAPADDAVSQPLVPPSTSKRQEVVDLHPKYSRKRKQPYVEIADTSTPKKRKKTKTAS